jgi:hypothetical protein
VTTGDETLARGAVDNSPIRVGDDVLIRGRVLKSVVGAGALVELLSKTDQIRTWIREDDLCWAVVDPDLPDEPADGSWLILDGRHRPDGNSMIFSRDDSEGHYDPDRRHQQHWFCHTGDHAGWMDWPAAARLGAASPQVQRMIILNDNPGGSQ